MAGFQTELGKFQTAAATAVEASGKDGPADADGVQGGGAAGARHLQGLPRDLPPRGGIGRARAPARRLARWRSASSARRPSSSPTMPRAAAGGRARGAARRRRRARRDLVLGRRLRLLPRRRRRRGRGSPEARRRPRAEDRRSAISSCRTSRPTPRTGSATGPPPISPTPCCAGSRRTAGTTIRPSPTPPSPAWSPATSPTSGPTCARCRRSRARPPGHALRFPFRLRRGLGLWKLAFLSRRPGRRARRRRPGARARPVPGRRPRPLRRVPHPAQVRRRAPTTRAGSPAPRRPAGERQGAQHHPGGRARRLVGGATSPTTSRPASPPTSIRSAARWSTCRRTWRCLPPEDRAAIAAYLKAVPAHAAAE